MQKIILNYLPPADIYTPSAALSILKSFMLEQGFDTEIKYWNFLFEPIIPLEISDKTEASILPFLSIINDQHQNLTGNSRAIDLLKEFLPEHSSKGEAYYTDLLEDAKTKILKTIRFELAKIDFEQLLLFGISSKFHQWIPGIILSEEIKKTAPNTQTIVGGFGSKEAAMEAMKVNPNFDFATWGEGEYPLFELAKQLKDKEYSYDSVPRLIYRDQGEIMISKVQGGDYLDFVNYPFPNYEDYFRTYPEPNKKYKIVIPLNSTRACSWNKCKFCDYNKGYRYRARTPESIIEEIEHVTNKYKSVCFSFVDNDIYANPNHFERLLDLMIQSINQYNYDYEFWAEMIPNMMLDASQMKKMQLAGFTQIFIGYDGITDSLLHKMDKSNRFSDNLFFVKYSLKYAIDPLVNIIKGVLGETKEDVLESFDNLHFLRFYYNDTESSLYHEYVTLVVSKMTKYFSMISDEEKESYDKNVIASLLPDYFSKDQDRFNLFRWEKSILDNAEQWEMMLEKEAFYSQNRYTYSLSEKSGVHSFTEFQNGDEIYSIDFEPDHWDTLKAANQKVCTLEELYSSLKKTQPGISLDRLKDILSELKKRHLLYCNQDFSNVITVIDVD